MIQYYSNMVCIILGAILLPLALIDYYRTRRLIILKLIYVLSIALLLGLSDIAIMKFIPSMSYFSEMIRLFLLVIVVKIFIQLESPKNIKITLLDFMIAFGLYLIYCLILFLRTSF